MKSCLIREGVNDLGLGPAVPHAAAVHAAGLSNHMAKTKERETNIRTNLK